VSVVANVAINIDGKQAESLLKSIQSEVEKLNGSFGKLEKPAQGFGASIKAAAGSVIGQLAAVTSAAFTLQQAFTTLSNQSKAEAALRTLGVDAGVATQQFAQLSKELNGQASIVELTTAAYDVASAGFTNTADQTKILEAATKGAVGGLSDINTVGNAVTSVLNAYGMSADQASGLVDGFIQTQNDGKIVLGEYAALIGRLAPTAAAAGVGIKELNAAVATITAQGVAPETAITGLNQALVSILKPTSEATNLSRQLGIDFSEAGLRSKGLAKFLDQVSTATGGSASQLTTLFGSVDALKAILPLLSGDMQKFVENLIKQDQAAGVASKAFNEMSATLEGALKEIDTAFKNLVVAFKPVIPAIIAPIKVLAGTLNLVAQNIKGIAIAAAFFGTFAVTMKSLLIAFKAYQAIVVATAAAKKALGIAAAFFNAVMNPAALAQIGIALGVATGAALALGAAMGDAGTKAEESKGKQAGIKDELAKATEELGKQSEALDQLTPKQQAQANKASEILSTLRQQSAAIDAQIQSLDRGASITSARYQAEKAISDLRGQELQREYELANTAQQKLNIAVEIFKQQIQAAEIEYKQALENIKLEQRKQELQIQSARVKYDEIKAEGELQILKAGTVEEEQKKREQLEKTLSAQSQVIDATAKTGEAQKEITKYQKTTAEAQFKSKVLAGQINFEQRATSKEIGISAKEANRFGSAISSNAIRANQLAQQMSNVAGQSERAANALNRIRVIQSSQPGGPVTVTNVPQFANGGVVTRPTLAVVGEGGENEYIVPESKAADFATNYLSGARGASSGSMSAGRAPTINITTGPVMQQNGTSYVTLADMESAMQTVVSTVLGNGRSAGGRRYTGVR
jgi:TP901 family phage tail tape measure protein